ncbi:MAG: M23 family metallopeptidase [Patescibacteria group bacterium]
MDQSLSPFSLARLWLFNLALLVIYITGIVGVPFLKSSVLEYQNVKSDPFDGTIYPIRYVPNWLDAKYSNKSTRFESIPAADFVDLPFYDPNIFEDDTDKGKIALLQRATYITPYMGSYRMNFQEYDGSHLGVDIRAPLGTPVLAIANGIVTKVNISNGGDGIYVVIRHDGVSFDGGAKQSYYSTYLHLESALAVEGTKIAKGQVLGKVGMTGVTTTPHLHFQIDKADAPFHAYWPYSLRDAQEAGLDFFDAVNVGLGKENAMKYTVHPMDFVQTLA